MPETIDYTRTITQNAYLEIAKGNVPGSSIVQIVGQNTNIGTIHQDIWDGGILSTLAYDAQGVNFVVGLQITGGTSNATAWIVADDDNGATGTLYIRDIIGTFQNNETITDSGTGTATSNEPVTNQQNQVRAVHEPTAGETWEVVCENTNDTVAGTGARVLLVTFMEEATRKYVNEIIALNGHTPVAFTSTDAYRFRSATVISWGSDTNDFAGKTNLGNIVIRDSVTKSVAGLMLFDVSVVGDEHGLNTTFNSNYTIESGVTAFPVFIAGNTPKNEDVTISTMVQLELSEGYLFVGGLSTYQNSNVLNIDAPAPVPEKTTVKFVANSADNESVEVNTQVVFILVEDQ